MNVMVKRIWWGWSMAVAFVLMILLGSSVRLGHAADPVAFAAGTVVTGDTVTAIGNLNLSLVEPYPGIEGVVSIGTGLLQPEGPANNITTDIGAGVSLFRMVTVGAAWDTQAKRGGMMVLGDVGSLIDYLSAPPEEPAAPVALGPREERLVALINRNP